MKILKYIIDAILSFLIILAVLLLVGIYIVDNKILNKDYILSKAEETEFYLQISREIENGFENYIYQSGLPEDTIKNLFSDDMIKNDVNSIIDYVYDEKEIKLSDEKLKSNLDSRIQDYLDSQNKKLNNQGKNNIDKFENLIVNEYKKNINVSNTLYSKANLAIKKINNIREKIGKLPVIVLVILIIVLILINIKDLLVAINFLSISSLSIGILLKIGTNLIFKHIDIDNLLILASSLSNLVKSIIKENLYMISDNSNIFIICGITGILIVSVLKNISSKKKEC